MPVSTPKYKNLFCQTLKKQVLIRGFLLYLRSFLTASKPGRSSITAAIKKGKGEKEKAKKKFQKLKSLKT